MQFEVICYRNGVESNHSQFVNTIQKAYDWILFNVKYNETAKILAHHIGRGFTVQCAVMAEFEGMTQTK